VETRLWCKKITSLIYIQKHNINQNGDAAIETAKQQ
jgi:hypothetical protein